MSNSLTALAPTLFAAADVVANEPANVLGAIDLRSLNAAYGDTVTIPVAPSASATSWTPSMAVSEGTSKTATSVAITQTASSVTSWHLTDEQVLSLSNGTGNDNRADWVKQLIAQGMRTLRNEAAAAALVVIKEGSSRAYGTAATTPFASDLTALTAIRKILRENGAPMADLQCIVDTAAYLNLTNLGIIQQAGMAGSDAERRDGIVRRQFGFQISEDSNIAAHTAGTNSGRLFSATEPVAETSLAYDGGSGTFKAGDVLAFGSGGGSGSADANKYVVSTDSSATPVLINKPGLKIQHVDNDTMTTTAAYTPNVAFERMAVVGFVRPPRIEPSGIISVMPITDTKGTGLQYLLTETRGYGEVTWQLHLQYGFKVVMPQFVATIIG
jgi:hypothetical protein